MGIVEIFRRRKRRFAKSILSGFAVSMILSLGSYLGYLDNIEARALDLLIGWRGQQRSSEIVLVQIDERAFEKLGEKQPLSRSYLASLIRIATRGGASVIGLDVELKVATDAAEDEDFLRAIHRSEKNGVGNVVLAYVIRPGKEDDAGVLYKRSSFFDSRINVAAGFANASIDSDGFVRQVPLAVRGSDDKILPSLALAMLARHAGYDAAGLDKALKRDPEIVLQLPETNLLRGQLRPQTTRMRFRLDDRWRINFAGGRDSFVTLPSDPLAQLAMANVPLAADNPFRGKIVLIGATFQESRDFFPTPYGLMSGMEIHANIIHTLLARSQIEPTRRLIGLGILLIFTLATSVLVTLFQPKSVMLLSLVAIPLVLPLSYLAFASLGLWLDFTLPLLAVGWGALAAELWERRQIRKSLGQYVGWEVAKQIINEDEASAGEKREVTVFFTDVRDFTTLCEGLPPEQVVVRMNELFAMMGKIIARHHGIILDFIGDAVLAVFGAPRENPKHAEAAARAGLEVLSGLDELNARWLSNGLAPLRIGIGLHTGEVVIGIVGTGERKKFDVTGDTVNTGSRVEGLNKELGTAILATRETVAQLNGVFATRSCGETAVRGRGKAVEVFQILPLPT